MGRRAFYPARPGAFMRPTGSTRAPAGHGPGRRARISGRTRAEGHGERPGPRRLPRTHRRASLSRPEPRGPHRAPPRALRRDPVREPRHPARPPDRPRSPRPRGEARAGPARRLLLRAEHALQGSARGAGLPRHLPRRPSPRGRDRDPPAHPHAPAGRPAGGAVRGGRGLRRRRARPPDSPRGGERDVGGPQRAPPSARGRPLGPAGEHRRRLDRSPRLHARAALPGGLRDGQPLHEHPPRARRSCRTSSSSAPGRRGG